jgi:DNA polymerase-3 subunit gamma/tau
MKITTIVLATVLAISSGCAFAAGAGTPGAAAGGAAGKAGSAGARAGMAAPGVAPGITTGVGTATTTGVPATPGLNANGPCNGASSTTAGGAC